MIDMTIYLNNVGEEVDLEDLDTLLGQAASVEVDFTQSSNKANRYVCIDVEVNMASKIKALNEILDMIDYASIGDYVTEIRFVD